MISVLMTVHKSENEKNLDDCLSSIVNQTKPPNQVVIVEGGQLPEVLIRVINKYKKIIPIDLIKQKNDGGIASSLNYGLKFCHNELVLRVDSDDINLASRFKSQYEYMCVNKHIVASSGWMCEFWEDNNINQTKKLPCDWKDILQFSKVRCPLNHPAVIFRKSIIESVGGYPLLGNEDYALWSLLIKKGYCLGNIPIILVKYRLGMSFLQRRGVHMLAKEIELLQYQRSIQFINSYEYYRNIFLRSLLRCSPYCLKKFLYQFSRTKYGLLPKK